MAKEADRIDSIEIQNFKFFPKISKPIQIDKKNMLLYGENGSGKSSIYWALYTLLEAANKDESEEIKKYFNPDHEEKLLNINLEQGLPETPESYIKINFSENDHFRVSLNDNSINQNEEAKISNYSSDFINYRHLLNLYNFAHSDEIDIFQFFTYAVLPYVKFSPITYWHKKKDGSVENRTTTSANEIYEFVRRGPQKNKKTKDGRNRYPKQSEQEYKDYEKIVNAFVSGLQTLITYINTEGNPILQDTDSGLGYNLKYKLIFDKSRILKDDKRHLNLEGAHFTEVLFKNSNAAIKEADFHKNSFVVTDQTFKRPNYHIWLKIDNYEGKIDAVKRAHSFLNEAKLTAVALAIRLAILKKRLEQDDAKLKLLVFDDLMISLDMSNREKVINLILNNFTKDYQVFILTHDKVMFEDTKRHIDIYHKAKAKENGVKDAEAQKESDKNWCFLEMYQASNDKYSFPYITEYSSSIQKAFYYFKEQVDFNACGNNLRTALEEFFLNFIPKADLEDATMLQGLNEKAKFYFSKVGFPIENLEKIDRYIKRSLNPTSHYNPKANYYRKELEDVFQIYFELQELRNDILIPVNSLLHYTINTEEGDEYSYTVKLLDDIHCYKKGDVDGFYLIDTDTMKYGYVSIEEKGKPTKNVTGDTPNYTLSELYNSTISFINSKLHKTPIKEIDIKGLFKTDDEKTLSELILEKNN